MKHTQTNDTPEKFIEENANKKKPASGRPQPLILNDASPFLIREAYKTTRANINFALGAKDGCRCFAITSSVATEGKTTTSINIAITFAQANAKVLLIDADMRKSSVHKYLGIKNSTGLSNVLSGFTQLNEVIKKTPHGFDCMTAGPTPPNPAELLMAQPCKDLISTLSQFYDYIIIDTPPVGVVSDILAITDIIDGIIVTVRERFTTHDQLEKTIAALQFADAKILGFILNDACGSDGTYRYRYRYKYDNKKGYDYGYDSYDNYY